MMCAKCETSLSGVMVIEGYCLPCFDKAVRSTGLPADTLAGILREGAVIS